MVLKKVRGLFLKTNPQVYVEDYNICKRTLILIKHPKCT